MRREASVAISAAIALLTLLCGVAPRHVERVHTTPLLVAAAVEDRDTPLPAGFAGTVDRATSDRFVRVVAGDVDRDGDIDVVASVGSLDLMVWTNDGAGHFTRVASSPHPAFQTQPPVPAVDGQSLTSSEWIQNGQPRGADVASRRAYHSDDPETPFSPIAGNAPGRYGPRVPSSRAPPTVRAL
jgi:hypothetical protein